MLEAKNHEAILEDTLRGQVKPDIITEIILSNHFNKKTGIVEPKENVYFSLTIGFDVNLLQYKKGDVLSNDSIILANEVKNDYDSNFQFQLTKNNGFLILAGENMLCT